MWVTLLPIGVAALLVPWRTRNHTSAGCGSVLANSVFSAIDRIRCGSRIGCASLIFDGFVEWLRLLMINYKNAYHHPVYFAKIVFDASFAVKSLYQRIMKVISTQFWQVLQ